jgi:hypothetical protein
MRKMHECTWSEFRYQGLLSCWCSFQLPSMAFFAFMCVDFVFLSAWGNGKSRERERERKRDLTSDCLLYAFLCNEVKTSVGWLSLFLTNLGKSCQFQFSQQVFYKGLDNFWRVSNFWKRKFSIAFIKITSQGFQWQFPEYIYNYLIYCEL